MVFLYGFRFINWHVKYLNKASRTTKYKMGAAYVVATLKTLKHLKHCPLPEVFVLWVLVINRHFFDIVPSIYTKPSWNRVFGAGGGFLKEQMNTNRGRGRVKPISISLCSLCEKNWLIFQSANRGLSNKLFDSC